MTKIPLFLSKDKMSHALTAVTGLQYWARPCSISFPDTINTRIASLSSGMGHFLWRWHSVLQNAHTHVNLSCLCWNSPDLVCCRKALELYENWYVLLFLDELGAMTIWTCLVRTLIIRVAPKSVLIKQVKLPAFHFTRVESRHYAYLFKEKIETLFIFFIFFPDFTLLLWIGSLRSIWTKWYRCPFIWMRLFEVRQCYKAKSTLSASFIF